MEQLMLIALGVALGVCIYLLVIVGRLQKSVGALEDVMRLLAIALSEVNPKVVVQRDTGRVP